MGEKRYIGRSTVRKLRQDLGTQNALYAFIIIALFTFLLTSTSGPFKGMLDYLPPYSLTMAFILLALLSLAGVVYSGMISRDMLGTIEEFDQKVDSVMQVTQMVGGEHEIDKVMKMVVRFSAGMTKSNACYIMLARGDKLVLASAVGARIDRLAGFEAPIAKDVGGMVMELCKPLVMDPGSGLDLLPTLQGVMRYRAQNLLCVPMMHKGRPFGIIEILNTRNEIFEDNDIKLVSFLADQLAISAAAAGYYAELPKAVAEEGMEAGPNATQ